MSSGSLPAAVTWIEQVIFGSFGTIIAVIAVAWVGFALLQGRIATRDGIRVVLGCFILFGAPIIARGFLQMARGSGEIAVPRQAASPPSPPVAPTKAPQLDPYAGASLPN